MRNARKNHDQVSLPQQRYVETIAEMIKEKGAARTKDIAERLGISLPSASESISRLVKQGLAARKSRFQITLTASGAELASQLDMKHNSLKRFIVEVMAMDEGKADLAACRIEHCVDSDFATRLQLMAECLEDNYPWALKGIARFINENKQNQNKADNFVI